MKVIAVVVIALIAVCARVVVEGRSALRTGDAAMAQGRIEDAIAAWETAARWYLPGAPHVGEAYDRLEQLTKVDPRHALAAWRAVRSAALATRSHGAELAAANAQIAELASRDPEGALAGGENAAARKAMHETRLARDFVPGRGGLVVGALTLVAWLAGIGFVLGSRRNG